MKSRLILTAKSINKFPAYPTMETSTNEERDESTGLHDHKKIYFYKKLISPVGQIEQPMAT